MPIYGVQFSPVPQSCLTLWPHRLQHTRLLCPSPTLGVGVMKYVHANSRQSCLTLWPYGRACQTPLSMEFSRQEYWSGLPCPPPGDLPNPGMEPVSPALAAMLFTTIATWEALMKYTQSQKQGILTSQLFPSRIVVQLLSRVWLFTTCGLQHTRLPCPSQSPEVCRDSYFMNRWCYPSHPLLSPPYPQSFPASGSSRIDVFLPVTHLRTQ